MRILVTGGTGFIGSHTCVELVKAGHSVVIIDNFSNSTPDVAQKIQEISGQAVSLYDGDILDYSCLENIFQKENIDAVIHFAGLKCVPESIKQPILYHKNNISGTINLCEVMQSFGCKRIIFSSSATVYGNDNLAPFKEGYKTSTTNPYGNSKLFIEGILTDICQSDPQWNAVMLRYFNPVGADQSGLIGENPVGIPNNLMPYISQVAAGKLEFLNIYGNDYNTTDGTGVRDYIHVIDLAIGHVKALDYIMSGSFGADIINLGTGNGTSVLQMVHAYEKANGIAIPYKIAPRRAGDVAVSYADPQKAKSILNWKAEKDIEQMCADSWHFAEKFYKHK